MELGSIIIESIKNIGSKDKGDDKENSSNHMGRHTVLITDTSIPIQEKKGRPRCCSPTPR
tara:strand:- start:40 stop:219 length:180 start_codon:yes stop_codon:yes gene_type:complete